MYCTCTVHSIISNAQTRVEDGLGSVNLNIGIDQDGLGLVYLNIRIDQDGLGLVNLNIRIDLDDLRIG